MFWNDETIGQLRGMWTDGMSVNQIGLAMGITRNAVIGKVHRCGFEKLERKFNPDNLKMRPSRPRRSDAFKPKKPRPVFNFASPFGPYPFAEAKQYIPKPSEIVCLEIPYNELTDSQCRFIPGEPTYDAPSCGLPVRRGGEAYCTGHAAMCFVKIPSRNQYTDRHINFVAETTAEAGRPVEVAAA